MNFRLILFYIFSVILFASCEKQIGLEDDNFQPKLVVNSLIDTANIVLVQVSKTSVMNDSTNPLIDGAKVELWEDGHFIEKLNNTEHGIYKSTVKPQIAVPYELVVSYPGFKTVRVSDTIPEPVQITDGTVIVNAYLDVEDPIHVITVHFEDPPTENNYYELTLRGKQYHIYTPYDTLVPADDSTWYIDNYIYLSSDDPVLIAEGDQDYHPKTIYFSDKLINGKKTSITIKLNTPNIQSMMLTGFDLIAVLRSVSYSYYQYKKTWWRHFFNQGVDLNIQSTDEFRAFLFTGEPVNLYNNVENGYGIFAGFSESYFILRRIDQK